MAAFDLVFGAEHSVTLKRSLGYSVPAARSVPQIRTIGGW